MGEPVARLDYHGVSARLDLDCTSPLGDGRRGAGGSRLQFLAVDWRRIGSEFLPHLDEGAIWLRGTSAPSTGPDDGTEDHEPRPHSSGLFPEVTQVISQVGRPDDGTDSTGFYNTEYFVDLKPKEAVAAGVPSGQRKADRRHGSRN